MLRCLTMWIGLTAATVCAQLPTADIQGDGEWLPFASKTLDSRSDYTVNPANLERSKYGGWKARRHDQGTGFFRAEKINGRWWCIDPEGYLYIHLALNSVSLEHQTADEIYTMMSEYGFNGFGNWTQDDPLPGRSVVRESTVKGITPMAHTPRVLFIATYRNSRLPAGTPRIELPVFDPGFETKAFEIANGFLPYVNDPHVFGYFSDNELPFNDVLQAHLGITNQNDPNYLAAFNFLATRGKTPANWDEADSDAYTALAGERYFSVVKRAIRSVDTNHMYLGSRCHSAEKANQAFMENVGKYVDIFSANHYHHWGDRRIATKNMAEWLGRPLMFTEFYVKSVADVSDSSGGAGFKGRNETSRALFYQNFISTHVESGSLVGFHWFKYADSGGSELGVINENGDLYTELLNSMKQINTQIYDFIDDVDTRPAPDATLNPEADAHFEGGTNRGDSSNLQVKFASSPGFSTFRQSYMRFDVSSLGNQIDSAKIVLRTVDSGGIGIFRVELVEDDSWGEATIRNSNAPAGSTVLQTFCDGRSDLEIDVSSVIRREIEGDGKLSIRIIATGNYGWIPTYGSRENPDPLARPVLNIKYMTYPTTTAYWDERVGSWGDVGNWSTDPEATGPNPEVVPGSLFDVTFNTVAQNADQIVDLNSLNRFSKSMTFRSPGTTFFRRDPVAAGTNYIALGVGGLTMQPGSGAVTFGDSNQSIEFRAQASLALTNNSSSLLQFNSPVYSVAPSGITTLTLNGSGSGGVDFGAAINNAVSGNSLTAVNINTTGGYSMFRSSSSNFSGGITLNSGVLAARGSNTLGAGTFTINGGTFGSVVSSRSFANNLFIHNNFRLGGVNVPGLGNSISIFSGAVDLGGGPRTITLADSATFNGVISNGGLTIVANPTTRVLTLGGNSTYTAQTNVNAGTLIINGNNSAATGVVNVASGARLGGNGTSGGEVFISPGGGLSARIADWSGAAGTGYDDLAVASLNAGGGALNLTVTTTGLTNFSESDKTFTILNAGGPIVGFNPLQVTITATGFPGAGKWAVLQSGSSLVLNYTAIVTDPFQSWIGPFNVADESKSGDPDNDEISNLMEFVLNGKPGISDTKILPDMALNSTDLTFTYVRRVDSVGVPQVVQYGFNLTGWTDVAIPTVVGSTTVGAASVTVGAPASGTQTVTVSIPRSGPETGKLFGRLKVGP